MEGILAVNLELKEEVSSKTTVRKYGQSASRKAKKGETEFDVSQDELVAFNEAGWLFVRPSKETILAEENRQTPEGTTMVGRVFKGDDNRILIGTNRLTVQLSKELTDAEVESELKAANLEIVNQLRFAPHMYEVLVGPNQDFLEVAVELTNHSAFVFAEPQMIEHIPLRFAPSDPDYDQQWQWNNDGSGGGTAGADVEAEAAWDFTRGTGIRVAVVDNGFDVTHTDLSGAITGAVGFYQNAGGGANFVLGLAGYPNGNHGTFCAGMAVARANNGSGGCGAANQAGLIPVACLGDQVGTQVTLARAIAYAADPTNEPNAVAAGLTANDGADIISCSLGPNGADWTMTAVLQNAIDFAVNSGRGGLGTPVFWAVTNGNFTLDGADGTDEVVSYANVIAVGRSTRNDTHDNSGYGPELDFLAPGVDVYSSTAGGGYGFDTGTSYAAPCAAGVGALVLAVNPDLTWIQVRQVLRNTCDKVGGDIYGEDNHHDRYGFGRVNAAQAVCIAGWVVELTTPSLTFNDIPESETTVRAAVFSVRSCQAVTFQIISGPIVTSGPGSFGTPLGISTTLGPTSDFTSPREARIWISHTGTNDGDITTGSVIIRCVQTNESWTIPITANTVSRPTVAVVLALDKSNSMNFNSGLSAPLDNRIDVLRFAAPPFADLIQEGNAIGVVAFDHDANDVLSVTPVGPPVIGAGRTSAKTAIANHNPNPMGNTAIGDALERAHFQLDPVGGYDEKATIVLTDGHETASKYIGDVTDLINERVFAIGLGTADQIQPAALTTLTNGTGGYILMTGALTDDDFFRLTKYYLQILAGVTNADIVLDPDGRLKPGQQHRIPFYLNETDIGSDVILLSPIPSIFNFELETPAGDIINPGIATGTPGISFYTGNSVGFYRMTLPVPIGGSQAATGTWHAVISLRQRYYTSYLSSLDNYPKMFQDVLAHGVRYSLSVHSYSNLRMTARLVQNSYEPGANMMLRAILTEYGLPIEDRASVRAELVRPDETQTTVILSEIEPGIFEAGIHATIPGIYRFRVLGAGKTLRGREFSREQLLTGSVWKGGDEPVPTSKDDPRERDERLCRFLYCLLDPNSISPELQERLYKVGLDLSYIRKCLKVHCNPSTGGLTLKYPEITSLLRPEVVNQLHAVLDNVNQAVVNP